jgi:iron complex transport system substrate-binding protein
MASIVALAPDLLLLSAPISEKDRVELQREGIPAVVIPAPRDLAEFREVYSLLGVILYGAFVGEEAGETVFSPIQQVCNNPDVFDLGRFVYITENMALATGDTLESSILSRFGQNLAEEGRGYVLNEQQTENLLANQPDVVLLNSDISLSSVRGHEVFGQFNAVTSGRVIALNNRYFERPTARITDLVHDMKSQYRLL